MGSEDSTYPRFVLDTSFLTQPKRDYYPFDIWPVFWKTLARLALERKIETIDKVQDELMRWTGEDELKTWIKDQPDGFCCSTDVAEVISAYKDISKWVQSGGFTPAAVAEFASAADGWIVAHAIANKRIVASQETFKGFTTKAVSIVNICRAFSIQHFGVNDVLRDLNIKFE